MSSIFSYEIRQELDWEVWCNDELEGQYATELEAFEFLADWLNSCVYIMRNEKKEQSGS
jgi:hypothetical protein